MTTIHDALDLTVQGSYPSLCPSPLESDLGPPGPAAPWTSDLGPLCLPPSDIRSKTPWHQPCPLLVTSGGLSRTPVQFVHLRTPAQRHLVVATESCIVSKQVV